MVVRLAVAASLMLALLLPAVCEAGWQHKEIVGGGGAFSSLAVGPDGNVHYFSGIGYLRHLTINRTGEVIAREQLEPETGGVSAATVDSANHLHLVLWDWDQTAIIYGFFDGSSWTFQEIPNSDYMLHCSNLLNLAVDSENYPHIACVANGEGYALDLLSYNGSSWSSDTVTAFGLNSLFPEAPTIALAGDGTIHIGFLDSGTISDASGSPGTWTINSTGQSGGSSPEGYFGPSVAVDSQGHPAIACAGPHGGVLYTHFDGSMWNTEAIVSGSVDYSNLLFAPGDVPSLVLLSDKANRRSTIATYAQRIDGLWKMRTIGSGPMLSSPRIALDNFGIPFVGADAGMDAVPIYAFLAEPAVSLNSLEVASSSVKGKTFLTGGLKLINQGTGAVGKFKLSYFLSDTAQLGGGATLLGSRVEAAPAVNREVGVTFKLRSPAANVSGEFLIAQIAPAHSSEAALVVNGGVLAAQIL